MPERLPIVVTTHAHVLLADSHVQEMLADSSVMRFALWLPSRSTNEPVILATLQLIRALVHGLGGGVDGVSSREALDAPSSSSSSSSTFSSSLGSFSSAIVTSRLSITADDASSATVFVRGFSAQRQAASLRGNRNVQLLADEGGISILINFLSWSGESNGHDNRSGTTVRAAVIDILSSLSRFGTDSSSSSSHPLRQRHSSDGASTRATRLTEAWLYRDVEFSLYRHAIPQLLAYLSTTAQSDLQTKLHTLQLLEHWLQHRGSCAQHSNVIAVVLLGPEASLVRTDSRHEALASFMSEIYPCILPLWLEPETSVAAMALSRCLLEIQNASQQASFLRDLLAVARDPRATMTVFVGVVELVFSHCTYQTFTKRERERGGSIICN